MGVGELVEVVVEAGGAGVVGGVGAVADAAAAAEDAVVVEDANRERLSLQHNQTVDTRR